MKYIQAYLQRLQELDDQQLLRHLKLAESPCDTRMQIDGRSMLTFCSNDYLGLANHPDVCAALEKGLRLYGAGSGASHLISGHSHAHEALEIALAKTQAAHIPECTAMYFSTGYMANLAAITALTIPWTVDDSVAIFSEELNHASLIDGVRLAKQQNKADSFVYAHNDIDGLEQLLKASSHSQKLIVTDGVFSMDGDLAPVRDLLDLAKRYDALLFVDDAHGFGVLGQNGHGILEHLALSEADTAAHLIYMGTLGKAAGVSGAFVAAHHTFTEWLLQKSRSYIYTTASPPHLAHALLSSLHLIEQSPLRERLQANIALFKKSLQLQHWSLMASDTAIQPVVIGENGMALQVAQQLLELGIWVPAIRPPTVPKNTARLRITLSAAHSTEDIQKLVQYLMQIESDLYA